MLCQCLYTRNILTDQLLKMRSLEVLELSQIQELVESRAVGGLSTGQEFSLECFHAVF